MNRLIHQARAWLTGSVDAHVLSLFRIVYGLFMVYEMTNYISIKLVRNMFFLPALNFKYDYLYWLKPLPEEWMNILLYVLLGCAVLITTGVFFKWACRIFALGYGYIFLLDKSIYNNHIYLFILLAILLSLTDADQCLSLRRGKPVRYDVPRWQPFVIQLQILIVYFYGGIAKISYDWMVRLEPVRTLINQMSADHALAPFYKHEFGVHLLSYVGFLIDIAAPFLLWYKPVRNWAIIPFIIFHLSNSVIFSDIGIFPYIMMIGLIIYFETKELPIIRKWVKKSRHLADKVRGDSKDLVLRGSAYAGVFAFLCIYFVFQLLFPFRGHFLPNDLDWTTIGNRFSWRMKVDTRQIAEMSFAVYDPEADSYSAIDIHSMVNDMQILNMAMDPRSVADFAILLKRKAHQYGILSPKVKAVIKLNYNGRPPQYFVDANRDMGSVQYSPFKRMDWIMPKPR